MLMCSEFFCTCSQHSFIYCLIRKENDKAKLLLEDLDDIYELVDASGRTLLHYSVEYHNAEMTQYLIEAGCDVDAQDNSGDTPLMLAVKIKNLQIAEILIKNNANIFMTNCHGKCSLQLAWKLAHMIRSDSRLILLMLFDNMNKDFLEGRLTNFLLDANDEVKLIVVSFGNVEIMKFILDNGYGIDFHDLGRGFTALHFAIVLARFKNAKILIERGANVDALDNSHNSPLYYYTKKFEGADEKSAVLKMFLRRSSKLSTIQRHGFTDVERLLMSGKENTVKTVLSEIDVYAYINHEYDTPLHLLVQNQRLEKLDFLAKLDFKLDLNQLNWDEKTTLMLAADSGCLSKVEFLLRHGVDVNVTAPNGTSALFWAVRQKLKNKDDQEKIIELLLQHGADAQSAINCDHTFMNKYSVSDKRVAAHLAMIEASLTGSSRNVIHSSPQLKTHFYLCLQQINRMKHFTVHGTVTLFNLLTERQDKITAYARNQELLSEWSSSMENLPQFDSYYVNTLQKRLSEGRETVKLQDNAALAIEKLTGLNSDVYHTIVYKIISYLNYRDLCNLGQIEFIP